MNDGISFELVVERWLRKRKGASFTERRARQRGRVAERGHECDVHATIASDVWKFIAFMTACCGLGCMIAGAVDEPGFAVAFGIAGLLNLILTSALLLSPRHVWVEVKSGETTIKRTDVWKLASQIDDVRSLPSAPWYPSQAWLVSRAPFDVDALSFAREKGVRCFIEQRGDIREVL